ncbi:barstar family protein [Kitasatospora sp. NPDC051853]|uniref:barstar family protein n=1 Tax=Kitasatospora sp. NPDC051853 TaxID=3364058 RepID=UPI0037BDF2C6
METSELVIDVRGFRIESAAEFADALRAVEPEALPGWRGRSLDALWDYIEHRGWSERIDRYQVLVVRAVRAGLFADGNRAGHDIAEVFGEATRARLELSD